MQTAIAQTKVASDENTNHEMKGETILWSAPHSVADWGRVAMRGLYNENIRY